MQCSIYSASWRINQFTKLLLIGSVMLLGLFLFQPKTQAQGTVPIDLAVSPQVVYLQVKPGQTLTHKVTVEQKGTLPLIVVPKVVDFVPDDATGKPTLETASSFPYLKLNLPEGATKPSVAGEDSANPDSFSLAPGQKRTITLSINVPESSLEKEYPLTILFQATADNSFTLGQTGTTVAGTIGSNLIVLVSRLDTNRSKLEINQLQAPTIIDSLQTLRFNIMLKNGGLHAAPATGSATITDWRGQTVATFPLYPDMVLGGYTRPARALTTVTTAEGKEEPQPTEFVHNAPFLIGPYTISVTLPDLRTNSTQNQQNVLTAETVVFAVPFSLIALLLLIPVLYWGSSVLNRQKKSDQIGH